ncbi:lipoprotein [Micromonospora sp. I033]
MIRRFAVLPVLALAALAGCTDEQAAPAGSTGHPAGTPAAGGPPWYDEVAPAPAAGAVGGTGSGCELPVSFSVPAGRKAEQVTIPEGELGEALGVLARRGGATARCEVDGRRAGAGFLRVWTADHPGTGPKPALEAYVTAGEGVADPAYRTVRSGAVDAVEATWTSTSELTGDASREWALAVRAGDQTVLLTTNESLIAEAADLLPGYRLAVRTLAVTG